MSDADRGLPTLAYALLGLLARDSLSGYALAQQLRDPIAHFWEARHSQIYPQLAEMERRGLVIGANAAGPGPRPRRTYTISAAGLATLKAWVGEPTRRWGGRDELLLKVYVSWTADQSATISLLAEAEAHHAAQLGRYLTERDACHRAGVDRLPPSDPRFTGYATLRRGIGHERGRLAWCRWLMRRVGASSESKVVANRL